MSRLAFGICVFLGLAGTAWAQSDPPTDPLPADSADAGATTASPDAGPPVAMAPDAEVAAPTPPADAAPAALTPAEPAKDEALEVPDLQIHGFISQGAYLSTGNDYLGHSKRGSVRFTEAGVSFSREVIDRLRVGMQLFARDLAPTSTYTVSLDWAFLDYRWRDWLGLRAGRVKMPFGLYNEYSDIDAARLPILLPQGVYPITSRDYLLAQTGFALYGSPKIGRLGALDYQAFFGSIFIPKNGNTAIREIDTHYVAGGQLFWRPPIEGLRLGGTFLHSKIDFSFQLDAATVAQLKMSGAVPASFDGTAILHLPSVNLWVASVEYTLRRWLFSAEYARQVASETSEPAGLVPSADDDSERFYGMVNYHLTDDLETGAYYSLHFADVNDRAGHDKRFKQSFMAYQRDLAATLRYDINEFWLVKLEGHFISGTADVSPDLNPDPLKLVKNWGLFLVKTTVSF